MGKIYEAIERARRSGLPLTSQMKKTGTEDDFRSPIDGVSRELVVIDKPGSITAELFRTLRSRIVHPPEGDPPRTILVTSALAGEGKTFVASNLAAAISQGLDEYVLLVDTDLRVPRMHRVFGYRDPIDGLSSHLEKNVPLERLLRKTPIEKLTILPGGNSTERPAELLTSMRMKRLIREVRDRYPDRFVVFDSTPLEITPETYVLAGEVDAVLLVVRYGVTPRHSVEATLDKIQRDKLIGIVFNGYDQLMKRYQKYGYHYSPHSHEKK